MKIILETARLYLREFIHSDGSHFYRLNNDEDVIKYTGNEPFKSLSEAKEFIKNNYSSHDIAVLIKSVKSIFDTSFYSIKDFILTTDSAKDKRIRIKLLNSGLKFEIYLDRKLIKSDAINMLNLNSDAKKDPYKIAVCLAKQIQKENIYQKKIPTATISQTIGCPSAKKGVLMKSLYSRYGRKIYSDNGFNVKYKKTNMRIIPHEYAPVISIIAQGVSSESLKKETDMFVNEMKNTIS